MKIFERKPTDQVLPTNVEIEIEEDETVWLELDCGFWGPKMEWTPFNTRKIRITKDS